MLKKILNRNNPVVAQFVVDTQINRQAMQKLLKDISKAQNFKKKIKAVCLVVDSPGGSASQSSIMGAKAQIFAKRRNVPFYTFAEDLAASGGYWLLCSGKDGVFASKNSLVGSIGVISAVANFRKLWDHAKIGRPVIETSPNLLQKKFDFLKEEGIREEDEEYLKDIQKKIFVDFREWVETNRDGKLDQSKLDQIFSADVYLGTEAKDLGLIDDFGEVKAKMRELYGDDIKIVNFSKVSRFERIAQQFSRSQGQMAGLDLRNLMMLLR